MPDALNGFLYFFRVIIFKSAGTDLFAVFWLDPFPITFILVVVAPFVCGLAKWFVFLSFFVLQNL